MRKATDPASLTPRQPLVKWQRPVPGHGRLRFGGAPKRKRPCWSHDLQQGLLANSYWTTDAFSVPRGNQELGRLPLALLVSPLDEIRASVTGGPAVWNPIRFCLADSTLSNQPRQIDLHRDILNVCWHSHVGAHSRAPWPPVPAQFSPAQTWAHSCAPLHGNAKQTNRVQYQHTLRIPAPDAWTSTRERLLMGTPSP